MEKDGQFWEKWISKMRKNERMHQNASSATAISVVNIDYLPHDVPRF